MRQGQRLCYSRRELRDLKQREPGFAPHVISNRIQGRTSNHHVPQVLEAAKKNNSPVMIQFSNGGAQFFAGKSLPNPKESLDACVLGAVAVRRLEENSVHSSRYSNVAVLSKAL